MPQLMFHITLLLAACVLAGTAAAQSNVQFGVFGAQPATGNVPAGTANHPTMVFSLGQFMGAPENFSAASVSFTGTATAADVPNFDLYYDADGSVTVSAGDTLLDSGSLAGAVIAFSGMTHSISVGAIDNFLIVADVAAGATNGDTFALGLTAANVTVSGGTPTALGPGATGNTQTIGTGTGGPAPEMDLERGGTPVAAASTDILGNRAAGQAFTLTYTVFNTGNANLNLNGAPNPVSIPAASLTNCAASVTSQPTTPVTPAGQTSFDISCTPTTTGQPFGFVVSIPNNDPNESPYNFVVQGDAVTFTATQLAITTQPGGGTGGVAWAQQPVVEARDGAGALDTTYTGPVLAAITAGPSSTLLGTVTVNCIAGEATFTDLAINLAGTGYVLTFTSGGLTAAVSNAFSITVGAAAQLSITTQPGNGTGGLPLSTAPVVAVQDAGGNTITTDTGRTITASIFTGPGAIVAGATANTATGAATFGTLAIDLVGSYTLDFDSTGLSDTQSNSFTITVGPADALMLVTQPGGASAASPFLTQPVLHIVDAGGNRRTGDSTTLVDAGIMAGTGTAGAVLGGTVQRQAAAGIVTFTDLEIDLPGSGYRLDFQDSGMTLPMEMSNTFGVAGVATQLGIATQPGGAVVSTAFVTQPVIEIRDVLGNVVGADSSTNVTAALIAGTGNLTGTTMVQAVNGIVTFTNLAIDAAGAGFQIQFTASPVLTPATSATFNVAGAATQLAVATQPGGAAPATAFTTQPVIEIRDGSGVLVATDNTTQVTVSITSGTGAVGAVLSGTLTVTAVNGVATFTNLSIDLAGTNYTLDFTDSGALTDTTSGAFNVATGGGGGGGGGDKDESGCSTGGNQGWLMLLALIALIGLAIRTRRA